ncbi:hypothetical protein ACOMHN_031681 [Nucella lapillus]
MVWHSNISALLELEPREAGPESRLTCSVVVVTNRPLEIQSAVVKLRSFGKSFRYKEDLTKWPQKVLRTDNYAPNCFAPVTLQPNCSNRIHVGQEFSRLIEYYLGNATLQVPSQRVPDTWSSVSKDYTGVVSHKVEAEVVYRRLDRMEYHPRRDWDGQFIENRTLHAEKGVVMRHIDVLVESFGAHLSSDSFAEERVGIPFRRGTIKCRLTARDTIGLVGQHLPLLVHIDNGSFKDLRKISLALYKELAFLDNVSIVMYRREELVHEVPLPNVPPHTSWHREITRFAIPNYCMTSASLSPCSFVELRFFVRLKVKWLLGSVKTDVTIKLGNTHVQPLPNLPPSGFEQHVIL